MRHVAHAHAIRIRTAILTFATALTLVAPAATLAAGTIDQDQEIFGSARSLIGTHENGQDVRHAQVFTAGQTGMLVQVDLPIRAVGDPGVPLQVEIRSLDGGGLPDAILGSATVPQASVPACNTAACVDKSPAGDYTTFAFVSVVLTSPAPITSGTAYAIELSATGANLDIYGDMIGRTANRYEWAATTDTSAYTAGDGLSYTGGLGWVPSNADKAFRTYVDPAYAATVLQPINADGSSTFKAGRGVIPVKFALTAGGSPTCSLPPATIALTRTSGATPETINESSYLLAADSGSTFRISDCQYVYNLNAKGLSSGTYRVDIQISDVTVGSASFELR